MLSAESLQVVVEEVVVEASEDSSSSRLEDIYTLLADGRYPQSMSPIRKKNLRRYAQKFVMDDGRLYYVGMKKEEKREVVIDAERRHQILLDCHFNELGHHLGQKKTVHRIQSKYYWLGIVKDVVDWIKLCEPCQLAERNKNMARTPRPSKVSGPWDIANVEVMGPFPCTLRGNAYVVVVTDYYSKWVEAFPVQKKDALCVARCISSTVYRYGSIKTLLCCQSSDFCEEVSTVLCERWSLAPKVQHTFLADRAGALLRDTVKQVVAERRAEWDDFIEPVLSLFRTSVNPATRFTPHCLMFNRKPSGPGEIKLDLLRYNQDSLSEEAEMNFLSSVQDQQNQLRQTVFSNMNASYKQEKKRVKRRSRGVSTITLTLTEPSSTPEASPAPKRLRNELFLTFPVETVIGAVQAEAGGQKSRSGSDGHVDSETQS
ncbi:gypsy retrotransposon integrase-like protein 1 [Trichomycterus rosablanca]|uniref:gypsy retrotransposon integrase-like protein 1 n=1 Tax=Trichomycterus rosablanca TaxID=2290929 RepID=UPI002F35214E